MVCGSDSLKWRQNGFCWFPKEMTALAEQKIKNKKKNPPAFQGIQPFN